jgi:hypothetical protein
MGRSTMFHVQFMSSYMNFAAFFSGIFRNTGLIIQNDTQFTINLKSADLALPFCFLYKYTLYHRLEVAIPF